MDEELLVVWFGMVRSGGVLGVGGRAAGRVS